MTKQSEESLCGNCRFLSIYIRLSGSCSYNCKYEDQDSSYWIKDPITGKSEYTGGYYMCEDKNSDLNCEHYLPNKRMRLIKYLFALLTRILK